MKGEEPEVDISDLPAGDYQLEAMFRVGIHRDCGSAGNGDAAVETSAVYYTYKHRSTHYITMIILNHVFWR